MVLRPLRAPLPGADELERGVRGLRAGAAALRRSNRRLFDALAVADARAPAPPAGADGPLVRRARAMAGLSQRELARVLHYSRSALAEAECGRRRVPERVAAWARRIAGAKTGPAGA